jgi:hypothetical protein
MNEMLWDCFDNELYYTYSLVKLIPFAYEQWLNLRRVSRFAVLGLRCQLLYPWTA